MMTPGPWRAVYFEEHDFWDVDASYLGGKSTGDDRYSVVEQLTEEDAKLIAVAPEMVGLIKEIVSARGCMPYTTSTLARLLEAVEKCDSFLNKVW